MCVPVFMKIFKLYYLLVIVKTNYGYIMNLAIYSIFIYLNSLFIM